MRQVLCFSLDQARLRRDPILTRKVGASACIEHLRRDQLTRDELMPKRLPRPAVLQRFGSLRVVIPEGRKTSAKGLRVNGYAALCLCDCGKIAAFRLTSLYSGYATSCGCMRGVKHGLCRNAKRHYIVAAFNGMTQRCANPNDKSYKNYGGRGIENRFDDPVHLLTVLGERPSPKHSIDRIDVDGHYEPGNVRWATDEEQKLNTRRNTRIEFQGRTLTASQWGEEMGLPRTLVSARLRIGWSIERALTTPVSR